MGFGLRDRRGFPPGRGREGHRIPSGPHATFRATQTSRFIAHSPRFVLLLPLLLLLGCSGIRPPRGIKPTYERILTTGYCDCGKCCGWERSWLRLGTPVYSSGPLKGHRKEVGITATGTETRHGTAAVDRRRYPYGTVFHVPGYGYARGEDAGSAIQGAHIDLWFPTHEAALRWGRKTLTVKVWRPTRR